MNINMSLNVFVEFHCQSYFKVCRHEQHGLGVNGPFLFYFYYQYLFLVLFSTFNPDTSKVQHKYSIKTHI